MLTIYSTLSFLCHLWFISWEWDQWRSIFSLKVRKF